MNTWVARHRRQLVVATPLVLLVVCAVVAEWIAPFDPAAPVGPALSAPSRTHLLGTTSIGQDVASRVIVGARSSVSVAGLTVVGTVPLGALMGVLAGLDRGVAGVALDRVIDVTMALPRLPFLIVVGAFAGSGLVTSAAALSSLAWAPVARIVRSQVVSLRGAGHLLAARGLGRTRTHLVSRHVVPEIGPILAVEAMTVAAQAVLLQATLAFLGLGDGHSISWGGDLQRTLTEPGVLLSTAWLWWALPCGLAVAALSGACMLATTAIERADVGRRGMS